MRLFLSVSSPLCEFLLLLELPLQLDDHANLLLVDRLPARLRLVARGVVGQRGGGEGGLDCLQGIIETPAHCSEHCTKNKDKNIIK